MAGNDNAAIYKDGHSKIIITQDDSTDYSDSYGTQFSITFSPEVNTSWIGRYSDNPEELMENLFVDGNVLSYTYDDSADTVFTYSWSGTLGAGESKTYLATVYVKEAERSTVKFYKYAATDPIIKEVLLGGSVKTESVHETSDFVYEWNTKQDGTGKYYPANRTVLVTEKNVVFYELKYDKNHNIVLEPNENVTITTENGNVVEHHGSITYNITPREGYKLVSVLVNNVEKISEVKDNVLTLSDVMGNANIEVKAVPDYKLTDGTNQKYVVNTDKRLQFKVNAGYDLFANGGKIYVDNVLVDEKYYSYENSDGIVLFTLNKEYLDSLSAGNHEVKFVFSDEGEAITTFNVEKTVEVNPATGDNIAFYSIIGTMSMCGLVGVGINLYRRKQKN